jgi:YVTN family beta-propeller protein
VKHTLTPFLVLATLAVLAGVAAADGLRRVYTANMESGTISVIDPDSMQVIGTIDARGHRTRHLALTPDQSRLLVTNMHNGTLVVIDTRTHEVLATVPTGRLAHAAAVTPGGRQAWVVNGEEEYVTIIDIASLTVVGRVALGHVIGAGYVGFSPDGSRAYVTSPRSGTLFVVDVASRRVLAVVRVGKAPTAIQVASDGRWLWGTETGGEEIYALDGRTNQIVGKLAVGQAPEDLAIVGERLYVSVGGTGEVVIVGDDRGGRVSVAARLQVGGRPKGVSPSVDGSRLYVAREETHDLAVIDLASQKLIATIPVGRRPVDVVASR